MVFSRVFVWLRRCWLVVELSKVVLVCCWRARSCLTMGTWLCRHWGSVQLSCIFRMSWFKQGIDPCCGLGSHTSRSGCSHQSHDPDLGGSVVAVAGSSVATVAVVLVVEVAAVDDAKVGRYDDSCSGCRCPVSSSCCSR